MHLQHFEDTLKTLREYRDDFAAPYLDEVIVENHVILEEKVLGEVIEEIV